jgi:NADP-dependent aldehyde dehydrogenase
MPGGVFALLYDSGNEVGKTLVTHPLVKAVGFTGSLKGGRALFDLAAARPEPIPVYAEMGSVNPIFLLPGAIAKNGEKIASGLHQSVTGSGGQFCTKPGLVFTNGNEEFYKKFIELMHGSAASCLLHKGIASNYAHGIERLQNQSAIKSLVTNSPTVKGCHASANVFETDVQSLLKDWSLGEEVFGPMTLLVRYKNVEELVEVAKHLPGQLGSAIHAVEEDYADAAKLLAVLETRAGRLIFNQFPTGLEVVPSVVHGGPYPATTDSRTTSVGTSAILRFARPVCFQNIPDELLPDVLKAGNPLKLRRSVEGKPEAKVEG